MRESFHPGCDAYCHTIISFKEAWLPTLSFYPFSRSFTLLTFFYTSFFFLYFKLFFSDFLVLSTFSHSVTLLTFFYTSYFSWFRRGKFFPMTLNKWNLRWFFFSFQKINFPTFMNTKKNSDENIDYTISLIS